MNRRQVLVSIGSAAAGSGAIIGTGAFSSSQVDRSVTVKTARDSAAFLRLVENGQAGRSAILGGQIRFDIPRLLEDEDDYNPSNPEGVGTNSVYRFSSDAGSDEPLFEVQNQGTQAVQIWGSQPREETEGGDSLPEVDIFSVDTGAVLTEDNPSELLEAGGDPVGCGLCIDTHDVNVRDETYQFEITIHAAVDDES